MPTFTQLVARVKSELLGYAMNQESVSFLTVSMGASDTTFQANGETITDLSRGLVEIDDELILIQKWDQSSGTVTVLAGTAGRGYLGTTAAAHNSNSLIVSSPAFPRARVKDAINDTIKAVYPHLVVFGSTEITKLAPVVEYELPSEADDIWYVVGQMAGPSKVWQPLPNWRYNPKANTTSFPSGKSLQVFDAVTPGQKVRVVYSKPPAALSADADDFAAVTGFADRIADLVIYGACKRLLPALESARLQLQAVEATERAPLVPPQSAARAVGMYASLYQERLEEERGLMFGEIPNYATFQGS